MELGLTHLLRSPIQACRRTAAAHVVEEAKLADELGLEVYAIGEHHRPDMAASARRWFLRRRRMHENDQALQCGHRAQLSRSGRRVPELRHPDLLSMHGLN